MKRSSADVRYLIVAGILLYTLLYNQITQVESNAATNLKRGGLLCYGGGEVALSVLL